MKKYFLALFIFILFPNISLAVSGSCSAHSGVNCKVISAMDGSAICNDGWVSSTQYSNTDECKQNTSPSYCIPPVASLCATESDYNNLVMKGASSGSQEYNPSWSQTLSACRSAITNYQAQQLTYQTCLSSATANKFSPTPIKVSNPVSNTECYVDQATHDKAVKDYTDLSNKMMVQAQDNLKKALNGDYSGESVADKAIRDINNSLLSQYQKTMNCKITQPAPVDLNQTCKTQFGQYAIQHPTKIGYCGCKDGYYFSKSEPSSCIPIDSYYCSLDNENYNETTKACVPIPTEPIKISAPTNNLEKNLPKKVSSLKINTSNNLTEKTVAPKIERQNTAITTQETPPVKPSFFKRIGLWFMNLFR